MHGRPIPFRHEPKCLTVAALGNGGFSLGRLSSYGEYGKLDIDCWCHVATPGILPTSTLNSTSAEFFVSNSVLSSFPLSVFLSVFLPGFPCPPVTSSCIFPVGQEGPCMEMILPFGLSDFPVPSTQQLGQITFLLGSGLRKEVFHSHIDPVSYTHLTLATKA